MRKHLVNTNFFKKISDPPSLFQYWIIHGLKIFRNHDAYGSILFTLNCSTAAATHFEILFITGYEKNEGILHLSSSSKQAKLPSFFFYHGLRKKLLVTKRILKKKNFFVLCIVSFYHHYDSYVVNSQVL